MTIAGAVDRATDQWRAVIDAPVISAAWAQEALRAMELTRTRNLREQRPAAIRVLRAGAELGRVDLEMRARLILADIEARNGSPVEAGSAVRSVQQQAEAIGDQFTLARSYYLLAWIEHSIGNYPAAQVNGIRGVELLPVDTEVDIRIDHIMMIGIANGRSEEGKRYFDEVLELLPACEDPVRVAIVYNNVAYAAVERGDLATASEYAEKMLQTVEQHGMRLFTVLSETIARVYLMSGRYDEAVAVLTPALQRLDNAAATQSDDLETYGRPAMMLALAEAHHKLGNLDAAEELLDHAALLARDANIRMMLANITRQQAYLHADRGDFKRAFAEFTSFYDTVQALQSEDERARAHLVQASFNADRSRESAERYRELAMRDPLTGLRNRRYMDELLAEEIALAQQQESPLSVAIIDADFFKRINDHLSHSVGDDVLQTLAAILVATRPDAGTICRLGGEEFVLVLPGQSADEAFRVCEALRQAVADHDWLALTGSLRVTVSIGVTTAPDGRTSQSALLSDADRNLYAAKRSGRNRVMADAR